MKHWVRDVRWTTRYPYGGIAEWLYLLYHFLRVMGWEWIWECDGVKWVDSDPNANHVDDGNMEEAGTAKWSAVGTATVTKVAAQHTGTQALSIKSNAGGDGAESVSMLGMQDTRYYRFAIWVANDTGAAWDVVFTGGGVPTTLGAIPDNGGVPTLYHFEGVSSAGGARSLSFLDSDASLGTLVVDAVHSFRSFFEWQPFVDTQTRTDGTITNPDQFSSGSYTFVGGDVGKVVVVRDLTNYKNTGIYPITMVVGGVATLDLRSLTAALTSANNLHWRLIDLANTPESGYYISVPDDDQKAVIKAGWGLQSPHSSKWRLFMRANLSYGSGGKGVLIWSAPQDTDFDFSSGIFYKSGPSVHNSIVLPYIRTTASWVGNRSVVSNPGSASSSAGAVASIFVMTDDDGSFLASVGKDIVPGPSRDGGIVIGYTGADVDHPGIQEFVQIAGWDQQGGVNELVLTDNTYSCWRTGVTFGPDGRAYFSTVDVLGYSSATLNVITQSNAGPNPWSGKEWIRPIRIVRDSGAYSTMISGSNGQQSERNTNIGVYHGRTNLPILSTFDNDNYIHFSAGLVWDWMGESLV